MRSDSPFLYGNMANEGVQEDVANAGLAIILDAPYRTNVAPPDQLNFKIAAAWPIWKKRFSRYMSVSCLEERDEAEKINAFMYMWEKSEEIFAQFQPKPTTYENVLTAFEDFFIPRKNVMFERFKFNSRIQQRGETVDAFITDLHTMADQCDFRDFKDELIRDRIIVGMSDAKLSKRLQLKQDLTLQDATIAAKQAEIQHRQNLIICDKDKEDRFVNFFNRNSNLGKGNKQHSTQGKQQKESTSNKTSSKSDLWKHNGSCSYCGGNS